MYSHGMFAHQAPEEGFLHIGNDRRGTDHDTLDRDELIDVYATKKKKKGLRSLPLLFFRHLLWGSRSRMFTADVKLKGRTYNEEEQTNE
jgi:hypothetical protein